jgi:cell division GTPase FtsZ
MFEILDSQSQEAVIKVIGVGGCGGNAVDHMIKKALKGLSLFVRILMHRHYLATNLNAQFSWELKLLKG